MKKIEFHQAISTVANIGVIASIIFLGFQLQQNNQLMASEARATYASMDQTGWGLIIDHPNLVAALIKDRKGEPLTEVEEYRLNALWMQGLAQWQFRYLEDRASTPWVTGQRRLWESYPSLRRTWQGKSSGSRQAGKDNFDPSFVKFYEEHIVRPDEHS